jgi:hypothetical protein
MNEQKTPADESPKRPGDVGDISQPPPFRRHEELTDVGASMRDLSRDAGEVARGWLEPNPYASLVVALGVGYVLGGGLPRVMVRRALGLGSRMAMDMMLARMLTRGQSSTE